MFVYISLLNFCGCVANLENLLLSKITQFTVLCYAALLKKYAQIILKLYASFPNKFAVMGT